jgi:hypothetical protein
MAKTKVVATRLPLDVVATLEARSGGSIGEYMKQIMTAVATKRG